MEQYLNHVFGLEDELFQKIPKKRLGIDLDWYSDVYGRIILSGRLTYEANKNFRGNDIINNYKKHNKIDKSCMVVLINSNASKNVSDNITNFKEFMSGQTFKVPDVFIIGKITSKYKKKSSEKNKIINFYINTDEVMIIDNITNLHQFVEKRLTFDCIYMDHPSHEDRLLNNLE